MPAQHINELNLHISLFTLIKALWERVYTHNYLSSRDPVEQTIRGDDREAAVATVNPLSTPIIPPLPKQLQNQDASVLDEEEWKIVKIVDKGWTENGYEYQMCWKKTWLLENELRNAQQLLQQFEAKYHAQRREKRRRPICADKNRWLLTTFAKKIAEVVNSQNF